jgi:general secretion pathway protein J
MNAPRRQSGLTLPELLVALLVFSAVAAASVGALRLGVEARDQLKEAERRLAEMQIANVIMKEDFAQVRARIVRDEFGEPARAAFRGGIEARPRSEPAGERRLLAFVRAGWSNPGFDAPRSSLQYVEYLEKDGALVRRIRPFLDDARGQPRFDRTLLSEVADVRFRFLAGEVRGGLDWIDLWPAPGGGAGPPAAVSLAFVSSRYGAVEERFWIGALDAGRGGEP